MSVIVSRGLGDKAGDAIVSEILSTETLQQERGTQEINLQDSDRRDLTGNMVRNIYMPPGDIVQTNRDGTVNNYYLNKLSMVIDLTNSFSLTTSLALEQVVEDNDD